MITCPDKNNEWIIFIQKYCMTLKINRLSQRVYLPEGHSEDSNQNQKLYMYQLQLS